MALRPDNDGFASIYETLGIIKVGNGYIDFKKNFKIVYNQDFVSARGIRFRFTDVAKLLYNGRMYTNNGNGLLVLSENIVYDYDTTTPSIGTVFNTTVDIVANKICEVCQVSCVGPINHKFTFMKVGPFIIIVKGLFSACDDPYILKHDGNDFAVIKLCDCYNYSSYSKLSDFIIGPTEEVGYHLGDKFDCANIKCPFATNHDPAHCKIIHFQICVTVCYVVVCSGKIRLVDGKAAGQRTKAALHESFD